MVVCQFDRLRRSDPASIRSALADLLESLDETYEQTLLGIEEGKRTYARCLFQCLSASICPLRVGELAAILAFRFDVHPIFSAAWHRKNAEEAVLSACSSLIMIADGEGGQVMQFSHVSVKEFLTSDRLANVDERLSYYHILPEPAHTLLAQACLGVLSRLDDKIDRNAIGDFPLAQYAARHWVDHAQIGNVTSHIEEGMERLFDPIKPHFAAWVWLYDIDRHWVDPMSGVHPTQPEAAPLYYAALCGFVGLVEHLLVSHSSDINCRGGSHTTPLHAATVKGHVQVISLLLRSGADPNSRDNLGRVPLHKVTDGGHFVMEQTSLEITRLLFDSGANVNVTDDEGCSPLHAAARNGYREVAQQLVEFGASLDARNQNQQTPLPRPLHQMARIHDDASLIQDLYPANTVHEYNLKSLGRDYAIITVKSHARTALDTPLLYFGEELKGFVILSLNNLSDMQNMDVAVSRLFFNNVTTIELGTRSCRFLIWTPISHRSRPGASCCRIRSMSLISQAEGFVGPLPLRRQPIPSGR